MLVILDRVHCTTKRYLFPPRVAMRPHHKLMFNSVGQLPRNYQQVSNLRHDVAAKPKLPLCSARRMGLVI